MDDRPRKLTDLMSEAAPPTFIYMKSVRTEKRSYCASAATIVAKFRWDNKLPKPIEESVVTVPPSAGGRGRLLVTLTLANHPYGAMLNVQPDGLAAACCPELVGCCACAPDTAAPASSPARAVAVTTRPNMTPNHNIK